MEIVIFIIAAIILIPGFIYLNHKSQSPDDNKDEIVKELEKNNMELIDIKVPKLFDTGPFPKFQVSVGPQTQVMGIR